MIKLLVIIIRFKYLKLNHKPGNNTDGQRKFRCEKITTVIALRSPTANYFLMNYSTAQPEKAQSQCESQFYK